MINTHKLPTILQSRENGSKDAVWRKAFWFIKANNHYKGKCGNTLVYTTNRCHKSQWWAGSRRSFSLPELKSKLLSCSLYTFLQSTLSSRIFRCSGNRTARSMQLKKTILWTAVKKKKKNILYALSLGGQGCLVWGKFQTVPPPKLNVVLTMPQPFRPLFSSWQGPRSFYERVIDSSFLGNSGPC